MSSHSSDERPLVRKVKPSAKDKGKAVMGETSDAAPARTTVPAPPSPPATIPHSEAPIATPVFGMDPEEYDSHVTEMDLEAIRSEFNIPPDVTMTLLKANERANRPPAGKFGAHRLMFKYGLRLPFNHFIRTVLCYFDLAPGQLSPVSYSVMVGMQILWWMKEWGDLTPEEFCHVYRPQLRGKGVYYLSSWGQSGTLMKKLDQSAGEYKRSFF